jgi:hypothetical protein
VPAWSSRRAWRALSISRQMRPTTVVRRAGHRSSRCRRGRGEARIRVPRPRLR